MPEVKARPERRRANKSATQSRLKTLIARNQVQNFSYNNFGIGEKTGTSETHEQAALVQNLIT